MKIQFLVKEKVPFVQLKYDQKEWFVIEEKLKSLGMEKSFTKKAWGIDEEEYYYKVVSKELARSLGFNGLFDDINRPLVDGEQLNCAIFRVIPKEDKVVVRLDKFLTIGELTIVFSGLQKIYERIFSLTTSAEGEFTFTTKVVVK